jgi:tRNA (guanine-N7-)-methyltransferase
MERARQRLIYGRRRGRKLRLGQAELKTSLLPQLRFAVPEQGRLDPHTLFDRPVEQIWLEIGFGGGEHLAWQAEQHPEHGMLGVEIFENGVVKLLGEIRNRSLSNVRLLVDDARLLLAALPDTSIDRAFVLFPDPWPKQRHHKRRIVASNTLAALARILRDGAELRLATDDPDYRRWILEAATAEPAFEWLARRPSDWRERPADWPPTRYEQKALAAGRVPTFLRFRRRPRGGSLS